MRKSFVAFAFAAFTLAQPAAAVTFPSLTTIYVGSGVRDDGAGTDQGIATNIVCSNVSGQAAQIRVLFLNFTGGIEGQRTVSVSHGATVTISTHLSATFSAENQVNTGIVDDGTVNIESTQSGVFCSAFIAQAAVAGAVAPLRLVRVNAHPGTEE